MYKDVSFFVGDFQTAPLYLHLGNGNQFDYDYRGYSAQDIMNAEYLVLAPHDGSKLTHYKTLVEIEIHLMNPGGIFKSAPQLKFAAPGSKPYKLQDSFSITNCRYLSNTAQLILQ